MKSILTASLLVGILSLTSSAFAQEETPRDTVRKDGFVNLYAGMYNLSTKFNDPLMTRVALYHLLISSPNKVAVLDSLALSYYDTQNWVSTILVTKENLIINPDNQLALELGGFAYEKIGLKDKALENYESLFLKNDNVNTLYKVAFLQYELKRYKESIASADILLNREDIVDQKLIFPKADKSQMEVSMKSALLNLKGLVAKAEGNITQSKEYFLQAIKETPGFEIAQKNLSEADK